MSSPRMLKEAAVAPAPDTAVGGVVYAMATALRSQYWRTSVPFQLDESHVNQWGLDCTLHSWSTYRTV